MQDRPDIWLYWYIRVLSMYTKNIAGVWGFKLGALVWIKFHIRPDIQWVQCSCIVCQNAGSAGILMQSGRISSGCNAYAGLAGYTALPVYQYYSYVYQRYCWGMGILFGALVSIEIQVWLDIQGVQGTSGRINCMLEIRLLIRMLSVITYKQLHIDSTINIHTLLSYSMSIVAHLVSVFVSHIPSIFFHFLLLFPYSNIALFVKMQVRPEIQWVQCTSGRLQDKF